MAPLAMMNGIAALVGSAEPRTPMNKSFAIGQLPLILQLRAASACCHSRAPAIQPVHSAMSSFASCGTGFCTSMSPSCRRPLGFEDSSHVAQGGVFVRHQVQHAVRDDHVSPAVLDRQGFAETFTEIDVVRACRRGARARFLQHGGCHVDADHITRCANHFAATRLSMPPPQPTSTTCSACCKAPTLNGLPVPANEAIVGSGIPSSQAS